MNLEKEVHKGTHQQEITILSFFSQFKVIFKLTITAISHRTLSAQILGQKVLPGLKSIKKKIRTIKKINKLMKENNIIPNILLAHSVIFLPRTSRNFYTILSFQSLFYDLYSNLKSFEKQRVLNLKKHLKTICEISKILQGKFRKK